MTKSGILAVKSDQLHSRGTIAPENRAPKEGDTQAVQYQRSNVIRVLAVSQLLLTTLTLTTAHVQIITRISSAYPVWVWYLATTYNVKGSMARGFVSFMVMYSIIQGGLFASFLPPA